MQGWLFGLIALSWVLMLTTVDTVKCNGHGLGETPALLWGVAIAVATAATVTEIWVVPPECSDGRFTSRFFTWLNILDVGTDCLSAGAIIGSHWCEDSKLDEAWKQVLDQSVLPFQMSLWLVAALAWAAGGIQLLLAFKMLLLADDDQADLRFAVGTDMMGFETLAAKGWKSGTAEQDGGPDGVADLGCPGDAEITLAEAPHRLLTADDAASPTGAAAALLVLHKFRRRGSDPSASARLISNEDKCIGAVFKLVFRVLTENLFEAHLQTTVLGLSLALEGWTPASCKMLVSVLLSVVVLLWKTHGGLRTLAEALKEEGDCPGSNYCTVCLAFSPAILCIVYAIAKMVAIFTCPDHVLNVTGCAEVDF